MNDQNQDKRTLIIILGETRAHELTYSNIKENLIDRLNADLCICIGVKPDYDCENPFYKEAKYRFLYDEPDDYAEAFDYANKEIKESTKEDIFEALYWRDFLKIKDQFMGGIKDAENEHPGSGAILIFFRWFLLKNLKGHGLIEEYDRFVITRSDYLFRLPHPHLQIMNPENIWIPDEEHYGGYTDRHTVLSKVNIEKYLNILPNMILRSYEYFEEMKNSEIEWNLEKLIKMHLTKNGIIEQVKEFPYVMYTVRPKNGTTRWQHGFFSNDHDYYIKYPTEYFKSLRYLELFQCNNVDLDHFYQHFIP